MNLYYEPKDKGTLDSTLNLSKYKVFEERIDNDTTLSSEQKYMLKLLATRQIDFNYNKIADYYVNAPKNIKEYIEDLRLVIVDTNRAIEKGYFKYFEDYQKLVDGIVNE